MSNFFLVTLLNLCGIRINFFSIFLFCRKAAPLNFQDKTTIKFAKALQKKDFSKAFFLGRNALQNVGTCTPLRIVRFFFTLDIERILFGFTLLLRVVTLFFPNIIYYSCVNFGSLGYLPCFKNIFKTPNVD